MTIRSEKIRIYQWLQMTLAAGAKLSDRFETQAAAQQVDRELRERLADMVYEDRSALAVNFATEKKDATEEEGRK